MVGEIDSVLKETDELSSILFKSIGTAKREKCDIFLGYWTFRVGYWTFKMKTNLFKKVACGVKLGW